jgi:hypothetical protein
MISSKLLRTGLLLSAVASLIGCLEGRDKKKSAAGATAASGNALSSVRSDTGIVEGVVIMDGDPAATQSGLEGRIPKGCPDALKTYGLVFREGPGRKAVDVFVGVTGYSGNAAEKSGVVPVTGRGCTWDKRTYGMTPNQSLAVKSGDNLPYMPVLLNNKSPASLVAVPGGDAVPVNPTRGPGLYVLFDELRNFTQATVLVWAHSTFDVTGLDGKFRIEGVPAGASKLSAFLPTADLTVEQQITVTKNSTTRVELKMRFDAAAYAAKMAVGTAPMGNSGVVAPQK